MNRIGQDLSSAGSSAPSALASLGQATNHDVPSKSGKLNSGWGTAATHWQHYCQIPSKAAFGWVDLFGPGSECSAGFSQPTRIMRASHHVGAMVS